LIWCGLFLLLGRPPRGIGLRGAALITAILGVPLRLLAILTTIATLWMLTGVAWIVVGTFYVLTAFWIVYLWLLFRGRIATASNLARWMARLSILESVSALNLAAGALIGLFSGGFTLSLYRPILALAFAISQFVYLNHSAGRSAQ
jgi:hypothetical protein